MQLHTLLAFDANRSPDAWFESIPARLAVFALFWGAPGDSGSPLYLGRTTNLRRRLTRLLGVPRTSSRMLNLRQQTRHIEYQCVGSPFEAQWLLYLLNKSHYPRDYPQRLRLKPPFLLKVNLRNRFPRCYPTRRLSDDGSLYYGPFPSRTTAEPFAAEFLDLFKMRRCVEDLNPAPSHPGCIYSQMHMCLAPCFAGCTDEEYRQEVGRVTAFLDAQGRSLLRELETERRRASEALEFEQAAKLHRRLEKVHDVLRLKPDLVRNLRELHAVVVQRGAEAKGVVFFRVAAGELRGPARLSLDENVPSPVPLDEQLHTLFESLSLMSHGTAPPRDTRGLSARTKGYSHLLRPFWEHLSLLARWYYSSFREGELLMLPPSQEIPHARLIRIFRKILATEP